MLGPKGERRICIVMCKILRAHTFTLKRTKMELCVQLSLRKQNQKGAENKTNKEEAKGNQIKMEK